MALSLPLQPSALSKHAGTEGKLRAGRAPWKRRSCCFLVVFKLLCLSWESLLNHCVLCGASCLGLWNTHLRSHGPAKGSFILV